MQTLVEVAAKETGVEVVDADHDEVMRVLDDMAQAEYGIAGSTFLDSLRVGKFDDEDSPAFGRVMSVVALLG